MAPRPHNHVTQAQEAARGAALRSAPWPEIPEELLEHLEGLFPPRCYDHRSESLEDHLQYAGAAGLVQTLRDRFEEQREAARMADPDGEGVSAHSVEVVRED